MDHDPGRFGGRDSRNLGLNPRALLVWWGWRFGQLPAVGGEWSIAKTPAANKESMEPGAVVVVPLKDGRLGVGQIVAIYDEDWQYYAMFASAYRPDALPSLPELVADDVALLGLSMDWRISEGAWKVVGTTPALSLTLPTYKVSILDYDQGLDGFYIESADGQLGRAVTDEEAEALAYRETLMPMMIEDALNAFHGLGSWEPWMDQLRYRGVVGSGDRCVPETVEHVSRENVRAGVVEPAAPEHAVVIHVPLSDGEWGGEAERFSLRELERVIIRAIDSAGAGELDGHEFGGGELVLYTYGPDADRLWATIEHVLPVADLPSGVFVIKRYGDAADSSAPQVRLQVT